MTPQRFRRGLWYPLKIHSHADLSPHYVWVTYQISGINFFQVSDDVTTRTSKVSNILSCDLSFSYPSPMC
ncbi:hypothetical protein Hanom_Chr04g00330501 [Helianthus anomalus]